MCCCNRWWRLIQQYIVLVVLFTNHYCVGNRKRVVRRNLWTVENSSIKIKIVIVWMGGLTACYASYYHQFQGYAEFCERISLAISILVPQNLVAVATSPLRSGWPLATVTTLCLLFVVYYQTRRCKICPSILMLIIWYCPCWDCSAIVFASLPHT